MNSALATVHGVLCSATAITDREIKSALWNFFFDAESSIAFLLGQYTPSFPRRTIRITCRLSSLPQTNSTRRRQPRLAHKVSCISTFRSLPLRALLESLAAIGDLHKEGAFVYSSQNSDGLPNRLGDLTLNPIPPPPTPSISKLAAKASANKLASTSPSTTAPPEKKLSKLQLKMLANQSARSARTANPTATPSLPPAASVPAPAPIPIDPFHKEPFFTQSSNQYRLAATASSFAFALNPQRKTPKDILRSITASFARSEAESITNAFDTESPDDLLKKAREGTKLAAGVVPKRK